MTKLPPAFFSPTSGMESPVLCLPFLSSFKGRTLRTPGTQNKPLPRRCRDLLGLKGSVTGTHPTARAAAEYGVGHGGSPVSWKTVSQRGCHPVTWPLLTSQGPSLCRALWGTQRRQGLHMAGPPSRWGTSGPRRESSTVGPSSLLAEMDQS